ncbi:MAG: MarR family transcriptional regulator [Pseudomonadota bacterium]
MSTNTASLPDVEIGQFVDRFMRRIHADLGRKAHAFDPERVGPAGGLILMTLADIEPAPIHELVRLIARDKSQVTRALQSLGRKGLIDRSMSAADGRVCVLSLTEKGAETVERLRLALAESIDKVLTPLAPDEKRMLKSLLRKALQA